MLLTYFGISLLSQKALGYARSCSLQWMFQRPSYLDATHVSFASTQWRNRYVPFNPYRSSPWSWACMPSKASKTGKEAWCFLISASELRLLLCMQRLGACGYGAGRQFERKSIDSPASHEKTDSHVRTDSHERTDPFAYPSQASQ